jgi:ribosomal protein S27E
MGLFSSTTAYCSVCGGVVDTSNHPHCTNCDAYAHKEFLKRSGNAKKESRLIRSDTIKLRCPNCGHVATL